MGWYFVGLVTWGTTLMLIVGLIINNIQRQFPVYWWTPLDVRRTRRKDVEVGPDATGGFREKTVDLAERQAINISALGVSLPEDLALDQDEAELLERLRERLKKRQDREMDEESSTSSTESGWEQQY